MSISPPLVSTPGPHIPLNTVLAEQPGLATKQTILFKGIQRGGMYLAHIVNHFQSELHPLVNSSFIEGTKLILEYYRHGQLVIESNLFN